MPGNLGWIDLAVLFAALLGAVAIGVVASRKNRSADAFLYADRSMPWWAILGSIVATETSAVTVLSVTGVGYGPAGMKFLTYAIGLLIGRTVVAFVLMPLFFQGKLSSAYEVLEQRFGPAARRFAAAVFLVARNLGDGLRLFLGALVMHQLVGWSFATCVLVAGGVTILYTLIGGIRSVVWNDCVQLLIYMVGGLVTLWLLKGMVPGGFGALTTGDTASKLNPFDFAFSLDSGMQVWVGIIGGAFLGMGSHGVDQMMVQRYLSTRTQHQASLALIISGIVVVGQFVLFLLVGVMLGLFYQEHGGAPAKSDEVYAHFIINYFPQNTGLAGLMLAAVLAATMSTLSSSFSASASSLLNDFVRPMLRVPMSARRMLRVSQAMAAGFGVVQIGIGLWASQWGGSVVMNALTITGFSLGVLLGMFALALFVRRAGSAAALTGACVGLPTVAFIHFGLPRYTDLTINGLWLALIGSATVLAVGAVTALLVPRAGGHS